MPCRLQIADLVSDVALALLRKESDWISGAIEVFKSNDEDKADDMFTQARRTNFRVLHEYDTVFQAKDCDNLSYKS